MAENNNSDLLLLFLMILEFDWIQLDGLTQGLALTAVAGAGIT